MEIANTMLALGGDMNNTVPKYRATASEIAVLRAIHGEGAVYDVEPVGSIKVSHRDELFRLRGIYGRAMGRDNKPIISELFPGAAARLFETIDELGLVPEQFKAEVRVRPAPKAAVPAAEAVEDETPAPVKAKPNTLTKKELQAFLTAQGIEYPKNATLSQLADLVEKITAEKQAGDEEIDDEQDADDAEADLDDFSDENNILD